jgi:valyl-tRNA synthetase (EC 6.1.1.9)
MENSSSRYNPKETEQRIYNDWEKKGYFNPDKSNPGTKKSLFGGFAAAQRDRHVAYGARA